MHTYKLQNVCLLRKYMIDLYYLYINIDMQVNAEDEGWAGEFSRGISHQDH